MSTILIIDDETFELSELQDALGDESIDFECASSGCEAREILEARPEAIDAILLDWELPDVEGIEFLEWVREQPRLAEGGASWLPTACSTWSTSIRAIRFVFPSHSPTRRNRIEETH